MTRRMNTKLSFAEQSSSPKGKMSVILGVISLLAAIVLIMISSAKHGNAGRAVGACGMVAVVTAAIGIGFGVASSKERDTQKGAGYVGFIMNLIIVIAWCCLFAIGI